MVLPIDLCALLMTSTYFSVASRANRRVVQSCLGQVGDLDVTVVVEQGGQSLVSTEAGLRSAQSQQIMINYQKSRFLFSVHFSGLNGLKSEKWKKIGSHNWEVY